MNEGSLYKTCPLFYLPNQNNRYMNEGIFNSGPEKRYDGYAKKEILKRMIAMKAPHIKNDLNQTRDFYYFDKKDNEWWIDTEDGYAEEILSKELVQKLDMIYKIKAKSNFKEDLVDGII